MAGATIRRILRFTLAELLVGTVFAGAVVGYFVLVYYGDTSFEPVVKSTGEKMAGHVRQAVFQAPDTLFVLVWKHRPFLKNIGEDFDHVYRVDLNTGKADIVASKRVTHSSDETHGGFSELYVSLDGKRLGLPNHDLREMELWDVEHGKLISTYNIHNRYPSSALVFSPRGEVYSPLLHEEYDKSEFPAPSNDHKCIGMVEIFPDNKRAVCIVEEKATVRGFPDGNVLYHVPHPALNHVGSFVSNNGELLIVYGAPGLAPRIGGKWRGWIWKSQPFDAMTGQPVGSAIETIGFYPNFVFDADGHYLANRGSIPNSPNESVVCVWDRLGQPVARFPNMGGVTAIALPVRGKVLLVNWNGKIEFKRYATTNDEIALLCVAAGAFLLLVVLRFRRALGSG